MTRSLLCVLGLLLIAARSEAQSVVVIALRASRPGIVGRFAIVRCTLKNEGTQTVPIKRITMTLSGGPGKEEDFAVSPPDSPVSGELRPGQRWTIRQFQKISAVGDYSCRVVLTDAQGRRIPLRFADGRLAAVPLSVIPAASVLRVQFDVRDPLPTHVYAPGQTIRLQVLPILTGGADLSPQVKSLEIVPAAKPFSVSDPATAQRLLGSGTAAQDGFRADFWGVPDASKSLEIIVTFTYPVDVSSLRLSGENLNDEYGLKDCVARVVRPDGGTTPLPVIRLLDGSRWTVLSAAATPMTASGLRLRVSTSYKLNITSLAIQGGPVEGQTPGRSAIVAAQWQDAFGKPLTKATLLRLFQENTVVSPRNVLPGYYGLVLTTRIAGVDPTRREYGFAVLPPQTGASHDPRLGMVHMDIGEPHLGVGWVKTLDTHFFDESTFTLDAADWQKAIADRRARGLEELPLMSDGDWASDSTRPVSPAQLGRIHDKMLQYFRATPDVQDWELGLEENLGYRGNRAQWLYYWPNLEAKARAVRQAAADAHADITLIYQIAERDPQTVVEFCRSRAHRQFDVLSLHPYAWPDFPPPEQWMPPYLAQVRGAMAKYHAPMPLWFTEIGAPVDGNPGGFFGYPSIPAFDRGLSRSEHAAYLLKCHLVAFHLGVQKVFWYTYRDGGDDPEFAEDHFGMIDFWGYPLPSYVAYSTMARLLAGKSFQSARTVARDVQVYRFGDEHEGCLVVWTYPAATKRVSLRAFGASPAHVMAVMDMLGRPVHGTTIAVSGNPIYIRVRP